MHTVVVGAERLESSTAAVTMIAHAVLDIGDAMSRSVALCGLPAEFLTLVPGLPWDDVAVSERCVHCQANMATTTPA